MAERITDAIRASHLGRNIRSRRRSANRKRLLSSVGTMNRFFLERLESSRFARFTTTSASGLAIGIDVHDEKSAERMGSRCVHRGLLLTTQGSKLLLLSALTIERAVAQGLDILEARTQ